MTRNEQELDQPRTPRWKRRALWLVAACLLAAGGLAIRNGWGPQRASADAPKKQTASKAANKTSTKLAAPPKSSGGNNKLSLTPSAVQQLNVMAIVNGEEISRNELGQDCLRHFGKEVLETLVNRQLIVEQCRKKNIGVTPEEVQKEIERMAERFGLATDQLLKMLQEERNITPQQYASEIIWPSVALRKLADERLKVSQKELQDAYDMLYGPSIQCRLIACATRKDAEKVHALAMESPSDFPTLAKEFSTDPSASSKGLIQPIHHNQGDPAIEKVAFSLKDGEVSEIIEVIGQFVIIRREREVEGTPVPIDKVEKVLVDSIRDKKLRTESDAIFKALQDQAKIVNVFNDPQKQKQSPGVAAIVNGTKITLRELAEACIERRGLEMLEGIINRKLLEQGCKQRKLEVSEADMQAEIVRAATLMGKTTKDGQPDIPGWLKEVTTEQHMTEELYRRENVWPSAALKKLALHDIQVDVTRDDLEKCFEANYGPRVQCRAIVVTQQRRAQQIWAELRDHTDADYFAKMAEKYSVDPGSNMNGGEIPPIARYCGQPQLEEEAFALKAGEISGVIQVGERWVILYCEGRTKPQGVKYAEVKQLMYDEIMEKKMRLAMAQKFSKLQDTARIDNFLAGTTHHPEHDKDSLLDDRQGLLANPDEGPKPVKKSRPAGRSPAGGARAPAAARRAATTVR